MAWTLSGFSTRPIAWALRGTVSDEERDRSTVQALENARARSADAEASSTGGSGASPFPPFFDPLLLVAGFTFDMRCTLVEGSFGVLGNDGHEARIRRLGAQTS
jgi:hypothetical protein